MVKELCCTGMEDEGAIFLMYGPRLLTNAHSDKQNQKNALKVALQVLAKCFQVAREKIPFDFSNSKHRSFRVSILNR